MAFRTTVGDDYQAKSMFDNFIQRQEDKARTVKRIDRSLVANAAQAAALASDAVSRGVRSCVVFVCVCMCALVCWMTLISGRPT